MREVIRAHSPRIRAGTRSPSAVRPVTVISGDPIMKSTWIAALVHPRDVGLVVQAQPVGRAERDVARGVLVEQRVEERRPGGPDAPLAVDERDLAEARGALVLAGVAAQHVGVLAGVDAHRAPARELDLEVADDRAADDERLGRAGDALAYDRDPAS